MEPELLNLLSSPTITVEQAARVLKVGRNVAYDAVKRGDIASKRIGGRILVLTMPLRRELGLEGAA